MSRIKPIEFRLRPTKIIGERFYIYASRPFDRLRAGAAGKLFLEGCRSAAKADGPAGSTGSPQAVWSHDLTMPTVAKSDGLQPVSTPMAG